MDAPVLDLGVSGAEAEQFVLDQERHDLGEADIRLLTVGEPGYLLSLDQRLAGGGLYVPQNAGSMADQRHGLAGGEEGLDQLDGIGVFGQVPHRAVAARIEDGVVVLLFHAIEAHRPIELALRVRVLLEATGDVRLEARILALGIERRTTALGRSQSDLRARVLKFIVGRGQLLQPEPGLAAGVAELVVGGQNHQDFHGRLLCSMLGAASLAQLGMFSNCARSSGFAHLRRRLVNISSTGSMPTGLSRLPSVTKIIPGKPSRLAVNTRAPHLGQKFRSRPLPDWAM